MFEMLSTADPPFLYAVAGVIILAVASLFGLVLFASREETFEDVVEKQRKAQEALLNSLQQGASTGKSNKQNRKWNKLKNKKASKVKGQEVQEIDSGVDDDDEITTEPAVTEQPPVEEAQPAPAPSKKKKKKKNKAQVQQAEPVQEVKIEEPIPVVEELAEQVEEVEVVEQTADEDEEEVEAVAAEDLSDEENGVEDIGEVSEEPEVELELEDDDDEEEEDEEQDLEQEEQEQEPEIEALEPEPELEQEPEPEVEAAQEPEEPEHLPEPDVAVPPIDSNPTATNPISAPEKTKSTKKKSGNKNKGGGNKSPLDKLQNDLINSDLNSEEVEKLMDVLISKQKELDEWQTPGKKSSLVEQLKSKIEELQQLFEEERQNASSIGAKLKDAKLELQQERNTRQSIQNEATNRLNQKAQESEAIRKRMEEKHISEMHSVQSQISRMQVIIDDNSTNHMELQRLKEENAHLKNASMMAQQLAEDKQSLMTELSQLQQTNKALRQEFDNLIIHHQQEMQNIQIAKVDSEGALSQRLQEMNEQLLKVESHNRSLQMEMSEQQQRLSEQQMISETYQMASSPVDERFELENEIKLLRKQLEDKETEKESELVGDEVASLVEMIAEKDQCIAELEQKVATLESNDGNSSGQQSPDLVVVTPGDLIGSEPVLANESFEEVLVEKEYVEEDSLKTEITEEIVVPEVDTTVECSPDPIPVVVEEEVAIVEMSPEESVPEELEEETTEVVENVEDIRETLDKVQAELKEAQSTISEHETAIALKQAEIEDLQSKILTIPAPVTEPINDTDDGSVAEYLTKISELEEALSSAQSSQTRVSELEEALSLAQSAETRVSELEEALSSAQSSQTKVSELEEALSLAQLAETRVSELEEALSSAQSSETRVAELEEALSSAKSADESIADYLAKISELEEKLSVKEAEVEASNASNEGESFEDLNNKLKEVKEELQNRVEATDELKQKNNELREKNWKVIDALAKAEQLNTENAKITDIAVKKGLKKLFPDLKLPKVNHDIDQLFTEFVVIVGDSVTTVDKDSDAERLKEVNKCLEEEIIELKKMNELMNASQDEMLKSQQENTQLVEENAHIKNVLIETESMLCRLQTGVDAEVQKWQKKVSEKDEELDKSKKSNEEITKVLTKHGYEVDDLIKLESSLSNGQKQLMAEKEEVSRMKTELVEAEKKVEELSKSGMNETNEEVTELNSKLKKTISERDLLIREYKNVKDSNTKMEADLKETKEKYENLNLEILENKSSGSGSEEIEKDTMIKKLTEEIEELREKLQDERDCVIVDIDPDNADNLHKQVEVLSTELQSEKQTKASLVSKLEDFEKSTDSADSLEAKLKFAEQRILELEAKQSNDAIESRSGTSV